MADQYNSQVKSVDDLVDHCSGLGLEIEDRRAARELFHRIGYFRLSGYMNPYRGDTAGGAARFRNGTTLGQIIDLYEFDRKLRSRVLTELEKIEVFTRAAVSDTLSVEKGPHWFMDPGNFRPEYDHDKFMEQLDLECERGRGRESHHAFIRKYYEEYTKPIYPPSWMVFEILSFGTTSRIFLGLSTVHRKAIARKFGINRSILASWLHTMSVLRNICAHHSRLWNRSFGICPRPDEQNLKRHFEREHAFYTQAVVIKVLLDQIGGSESWVGALKTLFLDYPDVPITNMGFLEDWEASGIWSKSYSKIVEA